MKLTFINHACFKVQTKTLGILCDPWVEGPAFNMGWDLLIPTPFNFDEILQGVTHIWVSHEHPDHFAVPFFVRLAKSEYKDKVTILFQHTRDKRVYSFLTSQGLKVQELADRKATNISRDVSVTCGVTDFYDSWLFINDGETTVLNINDCHTRTDKDVEKMASILPPTDVLLSQFSYASWKGGRENPHYRAMAASQKLQTLARQIKYLKPKYTIPFASMVYFANEENSYLNDMVNTPAKAALVIGEAGSRPIVVYPGDSWETADATWNNTPPLARYDEVYDRKDYLPLRPAGPSSSLPELKLAFDEYQKRVYTKNWESLIRLAAATSKLTPVKAFEPLVVELYDIDTVISLSVIDGIFEVPKGTREVDVKMHSSSMLFILKNEFGFDTLMVNGRFEATSRGFSKMTKSLAIGSLNAMGLSLSPKLLLEFKFVFMLLGILSGVLSKLAASDKQAKSQNPHPSPRLPERKTTNEESVTASRK